MRRFVFAATVTGVALSLATGGPAVAQIELGPVTAIATRAETPVERLPAAVTIIDAEEIERRGYQTLDEALRTVPGMTVVRQGPVGRNTTVFMRGTDGDHVLVLLNGVPINDASSPGNAFNFGNDLLGALERIEVVRGPASNLYGSNAIGGVINLVTKRAAADGLETDVAIAGGSFATLTGQVGTRYRQGPVDFALSFEGYRTDGENITPDRIASPFNEEDGAELAQLTATGGVDFRQGARLEAIGRFRTNEFDIDAAGTDDPDYVSGADQAFLQVVATAPVASDVDLRATAAWVEESRSNENGPQATTFGNSEFDGRRLFGEVQATWRPTFDAVRGGQPILIAGASIAEEAGEAQDGFNPFDVSETTYAVFASAMATIGDGLDLSGSARLDVPDAYDTTATWRVGASYRLDQVPVRLFVSAGTAFKAPSFADRFGFAGNPNLDPERSLSWEVGAEATLPVPGLSAPLTLSALYFDSEIDDLINFNATFTLVENIDEAEIDGVEIAAVLPFADWGSASAQYTYTDARDANTGTQLLRRPYHQASLTVDLFPLESVTLTGTARYVGERRDALVPAGGQGTVGADTTVDIAGSWAFSDRFTVFGEVENLFDAEVEPANGFAAPGLTALVGLRGAF